MTSDYRYDVFISHAVEDKISIANDLYERLQKAGLKVWYSGNELGIGDHIEQSIQKGLEQSRFGIVILSPVYINKTWTIREFYALLAKEREGKNVILPVLHNITIEDLRLKDPALADKFGISSSKGIDVVSDSLIKTIRNGGTEKQHAQAKSEYTNAHRATKIIGSTGVLFFFIALLLLFNKNDGPKEIFIVKSIDKRIDNLQRIIKNTHLLEMKNLQGKASSPDEITRFYTHFNDIKAHYRNEYEFFNGINTINFKKNVEAAVGINLESLAPFNTYGFQSPDIYIFNRKTDPHAIDAKYTLLNSQPIEYIIEEKEMTGDYQCKVYVSYKNNLRYLSVHLNFSKSSGWMKKKLMTLKGLFPEETFVFEKDKDEWVLREIKRNP